MTTPPLATRIAPEVDTPALLLDIEQTENNIAMLQAQATRAGVKLRPHAKAHKSTDIGRLQIAAGAAGLCCAKLAEAETMVAAGIDNLLITTPVVDARKIARLIGLARAAAVSVVVDDERNIHALADAAREAGTVQRVLVEVDVGQQRCGVAPGPRAAELATLVGRFASLGFDGLQGYHGRLQGIAGFALRAEAIDEAMRRLRLSQDALVSAGLGRSLRVTGGGTGSFSRDLQLGVLNELQPGSYVTMDTAYAGIEWDAAGSPPPLGQPLTVLTSVISRPARNRVIVDAGWKSISSDGGAPRVEGRPDLLFEFAGDEHASISTATGELHLAPGARLTLVPSHCDTTVNLHDRFVTHRAGAVAGFLPIQCRGKSQ